MTAIRAIRSLLFHGLFLGQTAVLAIVLGTIAVLTGMRRTGIGLAIGRYWGNANLRLLRHLAGIRSEVTGGENMPEGPCIIASKHQSDWDIFALLPYTSHPAFIAKAELINIPFFGWAARSIDTIRIDRSLGAQAIPAMLEDARGALARGCQIIIFPEGTRRPPLADPDYRQGIVRLYQALGVPVVPVAVNSGIFWPRHGLVLWPGTARATILPPIPPGLPAEAFRARLVEEIERETLALTRAAVAQATRPIPVAWHEKLRDTTTY